MVLSDLPILHTHSGGSVKNHADAMIFHTAICAAGVTNSKDHRAELDIRLVIPSAQAPAEWRLG